MKILFVSRVIGMFRGGGETYALHIAQALRREGDEVEFLAARPLFGAPRHPVQDFATTYVRTPYLRLLAERIRHLPCPTAWGRRLLNAVATAIYAFDDNLSQYLFFRRIRRHGLHRQYQITQTFSAPLLSALIVRRLHAASVVRFPGPPSRLYARLIQACSAAVANGDAWQFIRREISPEVINIPPGINHEIFRPGPSEARSWYGIAPKERVVLSVGRLVPVKNLDLLLRAFARVAQAEPAVKLLVVGEGPQKSALRKQAQQLQVDTHVVFAGHVDHTRLPAVYAAADLFVIASRYDNFPNAVLEAMASALPVIGTRVGGIPMQITDGKTGLLVESENIDALTEAILKLVRDPEFARGLGMRARETVRSRYNWQASGRAFHNLYNSLRSP
jgi:glycosyltransferase involved in cell wall biosynthesis